MNANGGAFREAL